MFSPIIVTWLLANLCIGFYNIFRFRPDVFKGLSPSYIYYFWSGQSTWAWKSLGHVMLVRPAAAAESSWTCPSTACYEIRCQNCIACVEHHLSLAVVSACAQAITGTEALYADMGHFSRPAIRVSARLQGFEELSRPVGSTAGCMLRQKLRGRNIGSRLIVAYAITTPFLATPIGTEPNSIYTTCCLLLPRLLQLSFVPLVYPSLAITYLGQTAFVLEQPEMSGSAFWASQPHALKWPMVWQPKPGQAQLAWELRGCMLSCT